ncbi:uncharacterized protein FOMMEDRAFT_145188 [Fomitiporia mediterranea MF3/22]|uniref:uncharacterized protein n=1 Tax=Fomitiporia mediterranea (strain MF3/22) TaxID=694068 RepID=UPI0004407A50|nr:uncharacterized protein FOMMEDRAFT_145188 [Fomitiporia mediterranea MF3/22]EJD05769.1 hypothetical protein FOMMEDRAFT_145188 [Fomitiporia mediterranea MF3/22]
MSGNVTLFEDHPLALELASLREAVAHYQLHALETENSHLKAELQVHRTTAPDTASHRDALQIQELTLALRRLSDKLDLTEKALFERNEELISTQSSLDAAKGSEGNMVEAANRLRAELEASHTRERDLLNRVRASEEQRKLSDLVVEEYANLVRSLEGRPSLAAQSDAKDSGSSPRGSLDGLMHARQGLHKLLQDSNADTEKMHAEIGRLNDALEMARSELELERATTIEGRRQLAQAQLEIHQLRRDDNAAAKMVSRYMKFSQSSTDMLHATIEKLKARQEAITASYESRLRQYNDRTAFEVRQSDILRRALDELTEDISRESYGRRREVALRLALLEKEEILSEGLRRWLLRSHEVLRKARSAQGDSVAETCERILNEAKDILYSINNPAEGENEPSSSVARVVAARAAVKMLQEELQRETDMRLYFEYQLATSQGNKPESSVVTQKSHGAQLFRHSNSITSVAPVSVPDAAESGENTGVSQRSSLTSRNPGQVTTAAFPSPGSETDILDPSGSPLVSDGPSMEPSITVTLAENSTEQGDEDYVDTGLPKIVNGSDTVLDNTPSMVPVIEQQRTGDKLQETLIDERDVLTGTTAEDTFVSTQNETDGRSSPKSPIRFHVEQENIPDPINVPSSGESDIEHELPTSVSEPVPNGAAKPSTVLLDQSHLSMEQDSRYKAPYDPPVHQIEKLTELDPAPLNEPQDGRVVLLLSKLAEVAERYADAQRSLRDCHLSLQGLKQSSSLASASSNILDSVIERLSDYCEDARVELEIRIADEERIAKGYQALLSIPGALSGEVNEEGMVRQIEGFLDGSDPAVHRAQDVLRRKLDDLQHDIASVKQVVHCTSSPILIPDDIPPKHEEQPRPTASSWASWTGSILTPSRSSSPAPTFGTVVTSPRLRHSSSSRSLRGDSNNPQSSLAKLGLRIPMPNLVNIQSEHVTSQLPMIRRGSRPRVTSNMLGLGLRSAMQGMHMPPHRIEHNRGPTAGKDEGKLDNDIE